MAWGPPPLKPSWTLWRSMPALTQQGGTRRFPFTMTASTRTCALGQGFFCNACGARGGLHVLANRLDLAPPPTRIDHRIIAEYDYLDANGGLLFQVVRLYPKDFRQRRPDGVGGWKWKFLALQPVLYNQPDLIAADPEEPVFAAEGEKDADALKRAGLSFDDRMGAEAAASVHGDAARQARRDHSLQRRGRAQTRAKREERPPRRSQRCCGHHLELSGLEDKGDVSDWLSAGGTGDELRLMAAEALTAAPGRNSARPSRVNLISAKELIKKDLPEPKWAVNYLP